MWQVWQPNVLGDLTPLRPKDIQWMKLEKAKRVKNHDYAGAFSMTWTELYNTQPDWWYPFTKQVLGQGRVFDLWRENVLKKKDWIVAVMGETVPFGPSADVAVRHMRHHVAYAPDINWVRMLDLRHLYEATDLTFTNYDGGDTLVHRLRNWADDRDRCISGNRLFSVRGQIPHVGIHNTPTTSTLRSTLRLPSGYLVRHEYTRPIKVCCVKAEHINQ